MALLMLDAGLRVGEVCRLRISDLFWNNEPVKSIIITAGLSKNKTERQVPVSQRLCEALKLMNQYIWSQCDKSHALYAFTSSDICSPFTPRQVERIILCAGSKSLGRRVTPHMLRHTFATRLAKKVNLRVVQELLGHKSITSTQIYVHPDSDDLTNAINHLNES